jgi:hypothetical protein
MHHSNFKNEQKGKDQSEQQSDMNKMELLTDIDESQQMELSELLLTKKSTSQKRKPTFKLQ